jgi:catechol 2,3-dioxygenase-like lactoylglutathione lyase family enzyme
MTSVRHAGIVVANLDRALNFYCGLLDLTIARRMRETGHFVSAILGLEDAAVETVKLSGSGDCQIELLAFAKPAPTMGAAPPLTRIGPTHIALVVNDLDQVYRRMSDQGVEFTTPPLISDDGGAKVTFCRDPDGTFLELVEPLRRSTS